MKKESFIGKLFKKKIPPPTINPEEELTPAGDSVEKIEYEDSGGVPLTEITIPETDETAIIGEIDIYVNDKKISCHKIESPTRVGRDPSRSDIIISELIVSKFHCTIYQQDKIVYVKDNNSTNGTYINNQRLTVQPIDHNTVIWLGRRGTVKLVFRKGGRP